jgi:hypothetical protein
MSSDSVPHYSPAQRSQQMTEDTRELVDDTYALLRECGLVLNRFYKDYAKAA